MGPECLFKTKQKKSENAKGVECAHKHLTWGQLLLDVGSGSRNKKTNLLITEVSSQRKARGFLRIQLAGKSREKVVNTNS